MSARVLILAAVVVIAALGAGVAVAAIAPDAPTRYQRQLQAQVESSAGVPKAGLDPAKQGQTSLASVARKPNDGAGGRGGKPARGVKLRKVKRAPSEVLDDSAGAVLGGCALGYGTPGEQCLPARAPRDRPMTCAYAVKLFPKGVRVSGGDRLKLDTDRDGVACDSGDRGAR